MVIRSDLMDGNDRSQQPRIVGDDEIVIENEERVRKGIVPWG